MKTENLKLLQKIEELRSFVEARSKNHDLDLRANLRVELRDSSGELKDLREIKNLITTAGKTALLSASAGQAIDSFDYIAIGTGTTAANAADTALETEVARAQGTTSNPTATSWKVTTTFAAGTGTGAITESGLLDASSSGDLLARQTFAVVNKGASDTLQVDWTLTIS